MKIYCLQPSNSKNPSSPINISYPSYPNGVSFPFTQDYSPTLTDIKMNFTPTTIIPLKETNKGIRDKYKEERDACTKHFDMWSEQEQVKN